MHQDGQLNILQAQGGKQMKIDSILLAKAEQKYRADLAGPRRAVRDDVITPFAIAMKLDGYFEASRYSRCSELRECPFCKQKYSTRYQKDGVIFWGCPHCQNITES